jgi:hypothetical protein
VNLSFGLWSLDDSELDSVADTLGVVLSRAVVAGDPPLVVAAAGNSGGDVAHEAIAGRLASRFPGIVLSVAATSEAGGVYQASNFGSPIGIAAPGENVRTTSTLVRCVAQECASGYASVFGTSIAAPLVSGVAALVLSHNPSLDAEALRRCLVESPAQDLPGHAFGLVDAERAVLCAGAGAEFPFEMDSYASLIGAFRQAIETEDLALFDSVIGPNAFGDNELLGGQWGCLGAGGFGWQPSAANLASLAADPAVTFQIGRVDVDCDQAWGVLVSGIQGRPIEYVDYFAGPEPVLRSATWENDSALFIFYYPGSAENSPPHFFGLAVGSPAAPLVAVSELP